MEWIALLAFVLCLVYLPKFRKVMMWIGIFGAGIGALGLGVWKIKDHYDEKRVAQAERQRDEEKTRELVGARQKVARHESLTDHDMDLLAKAGDFVPDPVQPQPAAKPPDRAEPFDPAKWLREHTERQKPQPKRDPPGKWEVVPDQKSP